MGARHPPSPVMKLGVRHPRKKAKKRRAERKERCGVLVENEAGSRRREERRNERENRGLRFEREAGSSLPSPARLVEKRTSE